MHSVTVSVCTTTRHKGRRFRKLIQTLLVALLLPQVPDNLVVPENVVEQRQRQLQLQQGDALLSEARNVAAADITEPATATTTTTTRTLGSSEFDAGFGRPSTVAKRVYALNGGLWGPNEEEEKEIALELARLREEVCCGVRSCVCCPLVGIVEVKVFGEVFADQSTQDRVLPRRDFCRVPFYIYHR